MTDVKTKTIDDMINDYMEYEKISGKSESYTIHFKYDAMTFKEYLESNNIDFLRLTINEAQDFQGYLLERKTRNGKYAESSIIRKMLVIKYFYNYLRESKYIYNNPYEYVKLIKQEKRILRYLLKEKELSDFLDKLSMFEEEKRLDKKMSRFKAYVISELMYSTGMRVSEVSLLKKDDIDFEKGIVKITDKKTKKERPGFLNDYAKSLLKLYIENIEEINCKSASKNKDYLFFAGTAGIMSTLNKTLQKVSGNPGFVSHNFRHSVGYHLLKRGCGIRYIQIILGHESINSTQVYTKVDKEDLKNVLDEYHPRTFDKR